MFDPFEFKDATHSGGFVNFGTAIERRASDPGTAAWLRYLVVALLIALAVPGLAMAQDAGTAVAEPPAPEATATSAPAPEATPPEAADEQAPADPAPAEATPGAQATPAAPPAAGSEGATVPVEDVPVELSGLPETEPVATPPPAAGEPVPTPGAAPELPEATPGTEPAPVVTLPSRATPAAPPAIQLAAATPPPAPPKPPVAVSTPTSTRLVGSLGTPSRPLAVEIGPPQTPRSAPVQRAARARTAMAAALGGAKNPFVLSSSSPVLNAPATSGPSGPPAPAAKTSVTEFAEGATVDLTAPQLVAPVGAAPAGSSLLAVLAGYVLPGTSGPPASTLVLLIVIGLILGVGYAARPQLSEAVVSINLLGASSGHGMAVRRPG